MSRVRDFIEWVKHDPRVIYDFNWDDWCGCAAYVTTDLEYKSGPSDDNTLICIEAAIYTPLVPFENEDGDLEWPDLDSSEQPSYPSGVPDWWSGLGMRYTKESAEHMINEKIWGYIRREEDVESGYFFANDIDLEPGDIVRGLNAPGVNAYDQLFFHGNAKGELSRLAEACTKYPQVETYGWG